MNKLGEKIVELRKTRGMSASDLARRVGVSRGFISLLEHDLSGVSPDKLVAIASVLGVRREDLDGVGFEGAHSSEWLSYLAKRYGLKHEDLRELKKLASKTGFIEYLTDEQPNEFKMRWVSFYEQMIPYLPSATTKYLSHPALRSALHTMGFESISHLTWRKILARFDEIVKHGAGRLNIENLESVALDGLDASAALEVAAVRSQVQSSPRLYGALARNGENRYIYINDANAYFNRLDFPRWCEVARALIDPKLQLGRGACYYPDGEDMPPFAFMIERLAARLAFTPYKREWLARVGNGPVTPMLVEEFTEQVYEGRMPWRAGFVALLDFIDRPMAYLDCYPRLKRSQLKEKGIRPEDLDAMCGDPDARLRVGFCFRNVAAEETGFELRANMRIAETSPIYRAFTKERRTSGAAGDDLERWDGDYDLHGKFVARYLAQTGNHQERHVRVVAEVLTAD